MKATFIPLVCNIFASDRMRLGSAKAVKTRFFRFVVALAFHYVRIPVRFC